MKQMYPINGKSKAKRIAWGPAQNQISWAYMKELRENHPCLMFDCNPYVEVYRFRDNLYGIFNQNCDGAGDVWMWLIIGPEKALLIDTAYGLGDSKKVCDQLTGGKELIVVNTHDHFDHAFGNCRFERVYCHKNLVPLLEAQNERMWDYLFDAEGKNIWLDFDRDDLPKFRYYEIIGVPDGYTWDLGGGYVIELINSGGHGGSGAAMYLDKHNKILFPGDNLCSDISGCGTVSYPLENCSLYQYRECVKKLVSRIDEYDYVFPMHFMVNIESNIMPNVLEALNDVLADPEIRFDYEETAPSPNGGEPRTRRFKYIRGFSCLAYTVVDQELPPVPAAVRALSK